MGNITNIVVAGLGGQGVIKASDILADAAFRAGFDVKKAEVHGMSQRGGSVTTDVRFGDKVHSPMVAIGAADFLVVLEESQIEPNLRYLAPKGILLSTGDIAMEHVPSPKTINTALLGLLSTHIALPEAAWEEALCAAFPESVREINRQAFAVGKAAR